MKTRHQQRGADAYHRGEPIEEAGPAPMMAIKIPRAWARASARPPRWRMPPKNWPDDVNDLKRHWRAAEMKPEIEPMHKPNDDAVTIT